MPTLSKEKQAKIFKMVELGMSNTSIGRALKISSETVRLYRGKKNEFKIHDGTKKKAGNSGGSNDKSINKSKAVKQQPSSGNEGPNPIGETIEFIGGKKDMADKKKSDGSTADDSFNICGSCGAEVKGEPDKCPSCGAEFDYE